MARHTPTLQAALDEYLATRRHTAANTQINDRSVLNLFVRHVGNIQVGHLTAQHVEDFFLGPQGLMQRNNARSYNKVRQRVSGFLTFCADRGYKRSPLMSNVRPMRVFHRERLRLTPAQMLDLLDRTADPRDRGMLAVAVNLGLRASEITGLQVGDVNLHAQTLHVVISKSGFEDLMPLSSDLEDELRRWLTAYARSIRSALTDEAYLFPARYAPRLRGMTTPGHPTMPQPGALRPEQRLTKPAAVVQRALRRIGLEIDAGEGFHTLRRSAGRAFFDSLLSAGHDEALRMTSAFLHHSSSQVTETYLGLQHERIKRDDALRGRPFLRAMVQADNVVRLPIVATNDGDA
jgi:integrase